MKDVESCGSGLKPKDVSSEVRLLLADYHRFEGAKYHILQESLAVFGVSTSESRSLVDRVVADESHRGVEKGGLRITR